MVNLPSRFDGVEALEEFMTRPTVELERDLAGIDEIMVLGVGGKMGPTLARLARRAGKRVIGVARFSEKGLREKLTAWGIECIACDLLERASLERLPRAKHVVFMAGHKFGAAGNPSLTWAMNVGVPFMVAETFRESRIVAFSTACVYPYAPVTGRGADESVATTPPAGDYANSCVGREQAFLYGSHRYRTPGRLKRLQYAVHMRHRVVPDGADLADQRERAGSAQRARARRRVRQALRQKADRHRQRSADRVARRYAGGAKALRRAARAACHDAR